MRKQRQVQIKYSFTQWCKDNNRQDILDRWDYDLNALSPDQVSYKSNKKYWFKCPRDIHESELNDIQYLALGRSRTIYCNKCRSFAQHIIDDFGEDYLNKIWNKDNILNPWEVFYKSTKKVIFNCLNKTTHVYKMKLQNFSEGQRCPYCSHKSRNGVDKEDSLGVLYPEIFSVWSDKNIKTPYDYYPGSGQKIWLKCRDGKHDDYQQTVQFAVKVGLRCPVCTVENYEEPKGELAKNWKGGTTPLNKLRRLNKDYHAWRTLVFEQDNYTCQCCGRRGYEINAHHIENFADHEDLRYDVNNGITLCDDCHNVIKSGSFHNIYGTLNNTPEQLEEYINNKRKQLGIQEEFILIEYKAGKILKPIN